jgi:hypothetical protein
VQEGPAFAASNRPERLQHPGDYKRNKVKRFTAIECATAIRRGVPGRMGL